MQDPWAELALFDWVLACGTTSRASLVLGIPQSSVSRRFRAFCASHRLDVRRSAGRFRLFRDDDYIQALRRVARSYRFRSASGNWALSAEVKLGCSLQLLPGHPIVLPADLWTCAQEYCDLGLIDVIYLPGYVDPLDGLPFVSASSLPTSGVELDGLLDFRRSLFRALETLSPPSSARPSRD